MTASNASLDHYRVLDLSYPGSASDIPSPSDIKLAYRRALLRHHPDKHGNQGSNTTYSPVYTLDQIFHAYQTLMNPRARVEYDQSIKSSHVAASLRGTAVHPGLETSDLDDLTFDPDHSAWSKNCRCGNQKGFLVVEKDLEENAEYGELITGCVGCSLWLRVTFAMINEG
jgi:diphthamide biosynthesis protein 4